MSPVHIASRGAAALLFLAASVAHATVPSHLYTLDGTLADALGGPSLSSSGGTLGTSSYSFAANQGLTLLGALPIGTYTIDTTFSFESTNGYRRIVDFKNSTSDTGLYVLNSALNFFNITTSPVPNIAPDTSVRITLSRDATGTVSGYVNGVLAISFADSGNLGSFDQPNGVAKFFIDDNAVGGEASAGVVDYIAIYNTALSAAEIATLTPAVPEPAGWAMLLAGMGVLGWVANRRR